MDTLSSDLLVLIFCHLGMKELQVARKVCRKWNAIIWQTFSLCQRYIDKYKIHMEEHQTGKLFDRYLGNMIKNCRLDRCVGWKYIGKMGMRVDHLPGVSFLPPSGTLQQTIDLSEYQSLNPHLRIFMLMMKVSHTLGTSSSLRLKLRLLGKNKNELDKWYHTNTFSNQTSDKPFILGRLVHLSNKPALIPKFVEVSILAEHTGGPRVNFTRLECFQLSLLTETDMDAWQKTQWLLKQYEYKKETTVTAISRLKQHMVPHEPHIRDTFRWLKLPNVTVGQRDTVILRVTVLDTQHRQLDWLTCFLLFELEAEFVLWSKETPILPVWIRLIKDAFTFKYTCDWGFPKEVIETNGRLSPRCFLRVLGLDSLKRDDTSADALGMYSIILTDH